MTVNMKNWNDLYTTIAAAPAEHMIMSWHGEAYNCGSPHCLEGWAWVLEAKKTPVERISPSNPYGNIYNNIGAFLGLSYGMGNIIANLLANNGTQIHFVTSEGRGFCFSMAKFDRLPPLTRKHMALKALENIAATGKPSWRDAITAIWSPDEIAKHLKLFEAPDAN